MRYLSGYLVPTVCIFRGFHFSDILVIELSNALFHRVVALLVPELGADVSKNVEKGKILP